MSQEIGTIQPAEEHGGLINVDKFPLGTRLYLYPWHVSILAVTCDFHQCGILTSVDSDEPVWHPFKLRNSK